MKLKHLIYLFLFLLYLNGFGQKPFLRPDSLVNPKFIIKVPVLGFIDVFGGFSYRVGTEFKIHNNISAYIEYGKYFPSTEKRNGDLFKAEIKFYKNKERSTGGYFSIEYLYKNVTFNFADSIAIPSTSRYEKDYIIHKEISCLTLKWGNLTVYKSKLVFEYYGGFGVRYYSNAYNNLTPLENQYILTGENHGDLVGDALRSVGTFWAPNINVGIKIGYLIK